MSGPDAACCVCGEPVDDSNASDCYGCGRRFHMNPRSDRPGKDCGEVWLDDTSMTLQFACRLCLDAARGITPAPAPQPAAAGRPAAAPHKRRYRRRA